MESVGQIQDFFLVRQVQGGNQAAFEQLVHVHDQAVLRLAFRITGSQSDAQDIYQEAFLKIYRNLDGFRFECSFTTWIYRMVTNLCLDHLRKTRSRRQSSATEVSKEGEEYDLLNQISDDRPAHNPEQQLLRRELSEHLSCALQTTTPRERMVLESKHFEGLKLRTVSEILNSSEGSGKTTLFRARTKLRSQLAGFRKREEVFDEARCDT